MDPTLLAAALGHGRHTHEHLDVLSAGKAVPLIPKGSQQPGRQGGACAGETVKQLVVRVLGGQVGDLLVVAFYRLQCHPELADQHLYLQAVSVDHGRIQGEWLR